MEPFSAHTPSSSSHSSRNGAWLPVLRPALTRAFPSPSWNTVCDSFDPYSDPSYPHISFTRNHAPERGPAQLLCSDSVRMYPSPPLGSSSSKCTIPLPEEVASLYSTHLAGVLDSPPIMRRVDLSPQKPLTPPPTMPHPTLNLPESDVETLFYDQDIEDTEEKCETDESCPFSSASSSPHSVLPLSPLSPSWDSSCAQTFSIASSHDFSESEHLDGLFSPCNPSKQPLLDYCHPSPISPHESLSLLEVDVDAPPPPLAPIDIPWSPSEPLDSDLGLPSISTPGSSWTSLTGYDELPPPSSPLISRLDLPDLEDDGPPKIVPSSPSRRSCSCLPDSDVEMGDSTSNPVFGLPSQQLLSLPGADTDDDLIPRIPSPTRPVPVAPSQPLLFIDDPRDVPLPRSPSPEDFDLCLSPEDITDPELAKLFDLRKRSIAAERAAKRLEALTEDVDLFTRAEARKKRKRERELSKEVGALLRLKLGDGVEVCPQEQSPECDPQNPRRRGVIGSMSQLVAQMVFRRNETYRPLAKRRSANIIRDYVRSSLSDSVILDDD